MICIVSQSASRDVALRQGERLLKFPNLRILSVGSRELLRVVKLMDAHEHLTPRDAIHVAAMTEHGIGSIVSDDGDFDAVPDVDRIGLDELDLPDDPT